MIDTVNSVGLVALIVIFLWIFVSACSEKWLEKNKDKVWWFMFLMFSLALILNVVKFPYSQLREIRNNAVATNWNIIEVKVSSIEKDNQLSREDEWLSKRISLLSEVEQRKNLPWEEPAEVEWSDEEWETLTEELIPSLFPRKPSEESHSPEDRSPSPPGNL